MGDNQQDDQEKYTDDQETFNLDFDQLYLSFITPIDALRSHFNAIASNSQELNTPQYQESRCHAFFRMIGFPVVQGDGNFHSPGFDLNLNTDAASLAKNATIDNSIVSNNNMVSKQLNPREQLVNDFKKLFADGGINAQAAALGSVFIRSFAKQFSGTDPLVFDPSQSQDIDERVKEITNFYALLGFTDFTILRSKHLLKPFVVDPRIDGYVKPIKNKICAPFLKDKSQTKIFQSSSGASDSLQRPFIERVITVRFNNQNILNKDPGLVKNIINDIKNDNRITDKNLISAISDPLGDLYSNELNIFNHYFKIIRIIIEKLVSEIREVQTIRQSINFNPVPDLKTGVEGGTSGGTLAQIDPGDQNNTETENNLINQLQNQALNNITFDAGLQGIPDSNDFVFSNLDDSVGMIHKNIQQSYSNNISQLTSNRNQLGNSAIDSLRNIEIIMGEFSGIGLIDMVAIQAALWIMPKNSLLGLIDANAFKRGQDFRPDLNLKNESPNSSIIASLQDFEKTLKNIYLLIQSYYDDIHSGKSTNA